MKNTFIVYKITVTKSVYMSECGTGYSIHPFGDSTDMIQGYDDGGERYYLPEGYEIAMSKGGTTEIYGPDGHCEIVTRLNGKPGIVNQRGVIPLEPAPDVIVV